MAAPKFNGILGAAYSTDAGVTFTAINNIVASDDSNITYPRPDAAPVDAFSNPYSSPHYAVITLMALDTTAYAALKTQHDADTRVRLQLDLDGGLQATMTVDHLVEVLKRPIESRHEGRSDGLAIQELRVPIADITIS